jgi:hypothetical protein
MKQTIINRIPEYAIIILFITSILPVIGLSYYNHPSVADDYCFAYIARDYGFWAGQKLYYEGWSGRYITNMVFHATPLAQNSYVFFKIMPILVLALMLHANFSLWRAFFPTLGVDSHIRYAFFFNTFYILFMPSWVNNFYWFCSALVYPTSMAFFQYFIVFSLKFYRTKNQIDKIPIAFFMSLMVFFIVGLNEIMMLLIVCFIAIVFGYQLLFKRVFNRLFLILFSIAICFSAIVILAPGNNVHLNGQGLIGAGFVRAIDEATESFFTQCFQWLFLSPLIPFTLFFGYFLKNHQSSFLPIFRIKIWVGIVAWLGLTIMAFFVIHYCNHLGIPERVLNLVYEIFILGWFYNVIVWQAKWQIFNKLFQKLNVPVFYYLPSVVLIFITFIFSTNLKIGYKELLKGTAKAYDKEMTERYELIRQTKSDTVYLSAIKNKPHMLNFDEIKTTNTHLWNKCYGQYFQKKVIVLK